MEGTASESPQDSESEQSYGRTTTIKCKMRIEKGVKRVKSLVISDELAGLSRQNSLTTRSSTSPVPCQPVVILDPTFSAPSFQSQAAPPNEIVNRSSGARPPLIDIETERIGR